MRANGKYLTVVALLSVLAVAFGVLGTVAPPLAEESAPIQPQQESSPDSVGHFTNPPTYDSGWVNITTKAGQYVTLKHNLNTTNVVVDITGKQSLDPRSGTLVWNKTYGGDFPDLAYFGIQTSDGGYALTGQTWSYMTGGGGGDFWLVKTDSAGNKMWNKSYGGKNTDEAYSVVQTDDGGYALAGYFASNDFWLVKTDSNGNKQWNKTYGGASSDYAYSAIQTSDGGYALAGYTASYGAGGADFWLVKTDSAGNKLWNRTYGGTSWDGAYSVVQTDDEGYALAGSTYSYGAGGGDFWLVKTDSDGNMQWNKTYGGTNLDAAYSVVQTSDGEYTMSGQTYSFGIGGADFWLVKTDSAGNKLWNRTYGGTSWDGAYSVVQTDDEGYALAGYTTSFGAGGYDFWLVKTDSAGNMLWNRTYGGTYDDLARSVVQTNDKEYALTGYFSIASYDFALVKVKPYMNLEHQRNFGNENGLVWTGLTNTTIILYRGTTDPYWNYVCVRIWLVKEPAWIYGDINMDGVVDAEDLYIIGRNYGKTFSLLSLSGIIAIAGIRTVKKRRQSKQPSYIN